MGGEQGRSGGTSYKGIQPRGRYVLVRRLRRPDTTPGGLVLPSTMRHFFYQAEVLALGPGVWCESCKRAPIDDLRVGDLVMVQDDPPAQHKGQPRPKINFDVEVDGETLYLASDNMILAIDLNTEITDAERFIPSPSDEQSSSKPVVALA